MQVLTKKQKSEFLLLDADSTSKETTLIAQESVHK